MSGTLIELLAREVAALFAPMSAIRDNPARLDDLLFDVGAVTPPDVRPALLAGATALAGLNDRLDALARQSSLSVATISSLLEIARDAFTVVRQLEQVRGAPPWFTGLGHAVHQLQDIGSHPPTTLTATHTSAPATGA